MKKSRLQKVGNEITNVRISFLLIIFVILLGGLTFAADDFYNFALNDPVLPQNDNLFQNSQEGISLFTGGFSYTYMIVVPKGTNDLQPDIRLSYSSQSSLSKTSVVGSGWSLSSNYIQRMVNGTFLNSTQSDDFFVLNFQGDSQKLRYDSGSGRFRTRIDSFLFINNSSGGSNTNGQYWMVRTKDGVTYRFGYRSDSEEVSSLYSYTIKWHLDQVTDLYGNTITYNYSENPYSGETGATYLTNITYNNDSLRRITFIYDSADRSDKRVLYDEATRTHQLRRLTNISIWFNNTLVRRYDIRYWTNVSTAMIANITVVGSDGVTSLPPEIFDYYYDEGWTQDDDYLPGTDYNFESSTGNDEGVRTEDLNGDGLIDVIRDDSCGGCDYAAYNLNGAWQTGAPTSPIEDFTQDSPPEDEGVRFADLNGDGWTDITKYESGSSPFSYLNNITNWVRNDTWESPNPFVTATSGFDEGVRLADINGDGLVDALYGVFSSGSCTLSTSSGFTGSCPWSDIYFVDSSGEDRGYRFADMNGDGLVDLPYGRYTTSSSGTEGFLVNNGSDWTTDSTLDTLNQYRFVTDSGNDRGYRLFDVNGDGLTDILFSRDTGSIVDGVYLNTGTTMEFFDDTHPWNSPFVFTKSPSSSKGVRIADLNGDGLADLIRNQDCASAACHRVYLNDGYRNFLLRSIKTSSGANITIDYNPSTRYNNTGGDGKSDLPFNINVVANITYDNGLTGSAAVRDTYYYSYKDGRQYYSRENSEFRGFGFINETVPTGGYVHHYFNQTEGLSGKEERTELFNSSGSKLLVARNTYQLINNSLYFTPQLRSSQTERYDGNSIPTTTVISYSYDPYNNLANTSYLGDSSLAGDEREERRAYTYSASTWLVQQLTSRTLLSSSNTTTVRQTNSTYNAFGEPNMTINYVAGSANTNMTFSYDAYGNVLVATNERGYQTNYTYDAAVRSFPLIVTNALGHQTQYVYDYRYEKQTKVTDPNGFATNTTFDVFGRELTVVKPSDSPATPTITYAYVLDGAAPELISTQLKMASSSNVTVSQHLDGNRKIVQEKRSMEGGVFSATDSFYDVKKRLEQQSNPYKASASTYSTLNNTTVTQVTFDPLDRPIAKLNPDGNSSRITYDRNTTSVYDENNNRKDIIKDAYGNILRVIEYNGAETYATNYTYNAANELLSIADTQGNVITFTYDTLGRKKSIIDPDIGTWNYTYDAAGNLLTQRDNRGNTTTFTYDALNRPLTKTSGTEAITYTYDGVKGTLTKVSTSDYNQTYGYDQRLRKVQENLTIDGITFTTNYTYDSMDHITQESLPGGTMLNFTYNVQGLLESIPGFIGDLNYTAQSTPSARAYANGLTTSYSYLSANQRLQRIQTSSLQNLNYTYDAVGNILAVGDTSNNALETFTYDDLDRISTANKINATGTVYDFTYTINPRNMITQIVGTDETLTFSFSGTSHAPTSYEVS